MTGSCCTAVLTSYGKVQKQFLFLSATTAILDLSITKKQIKLMKNLTVNDACMCKCLQKLTSAISPNTLRFRALYCAFANVTMTQWSRWSHFTLQRKCSNKFSNREQVL